MRNKNVIKLNKSLNDPKVRDMPLKYFDEFFMNKVVEYLKIEGNLILIMLYNTHHCIVDTNRDIFSFVENSDGAVYYKFYYMHYGRNFIVCDRPHFQLIQLLFPKADAMIRDVVISNETE